MIYFEHKPRGQKSQNHLTREEKRKKKLPITGCGGP
jgi:hypothetical protein